MTTLRDQLQAILGDGYTLERELGGGGMSRVFVARDIALGRDIVVKVLAPELAASVSNERFTREIATAARLQQANIVPVLAAGTSGGISYYTMPFVRGESLRAQLSRGLAMSMSERLDVLRDVARALAYAHGEQVIHRDIKPDNILLSAGTAVVTDFGIAKAISASRTIEGAPAGDGTLTQVGGSIGTPAYMAPEQAVGEQVDQRADLYAWGVVAYELLSGTHPFADKVGTSQLIAAHLAEQPRALADHVPELPRDVAALVMQCLAKAPAARPAQAAELLTRLAAVSTPSVEAPASAGKRPRRTSFLLVGALAIAVALASWAALRKPTTAPAAMPSPGAPDVLSSIAVLPFVNTSGDAKDEYFSDGLTDELSHALSKLADLRIAGRSSSFAFKGRSVPAPEVGRTLNVQAIVEGTVRRAGDRIRLTAQLVSTQSGDVMWSDVFERSGADVFAVQDAFTSAIVGALAPLLGGVRPDGALATSARGTQDAAAYDMYLKGRFYWAQRGAGPGDSSVTYLEATVQRDPGFARGWAGLALAHVIQPNYNSEVDFDASDVRAAEAARRALALDSTLADAHTALGFLHLRRLRFAEANAAFATARRLEPQSAIAAHWSAIYFHATGSTAEADRLMGLALTLDPLSSTTVNSNALMLTERREFARAREYQNRITAIGPGFPLNRTYTLIWSGLSDSAFSATQRGLTSRSRGRFGAAILAAAAAGHWTEARALRTQIIAGGAAITSFDRAMADVVFGSRAAAAAGFVDHLERGGGLANIAFSVCFPPYDAVRREPTWQAFLARHSLQDCPLSSPWPIGAAPP